MADEPLRIALEHIASGLRAPLQAALRNYTEELRRLAAADRAAAVRDAVEAARKAEREQAQRELAELHGQLTARIEEVTRQSEQQLESARATAAAEATALRAAAEADVTAARTAAEVDVAAARTAAQADVNAARVAAEAAVALARQNAEAELDALRHALEAQAAAARTNAEEERAKAEQAFDTRLAQSRRELEDALRAADAVRGDLAGARHEAEERRQAVDAAHAELDDLRRRHTADGRIAARMRRLLDGIEALDRASSLGEVLSRVAEVPARDGRRVLLLMVEGQRLREWKTPARAGAHAQGRVEAALDDAGFVADAVKTRGVVIAGGREDERRPVFAGPEYRGAAALPILVGGAVVALLYVDAPPPGPAQEPDVLGDLELIARHAGRVLEAMTVERAMGVAARPSAHAASAGLQEGSP